MKLTKNDKAILESYSNMVEGLAAYMGPGHEFVIHSLEDINHSVVKIVNGHYSNRKEGAPMTNVALGMLKKITEADSEVVSCPPYFSRNSQGVLLKSTTIPIRGEGKKLLGMLCINFYMNTPVDAVIESLNPESPPQLSESSEIFASNVDQVIVSAVSEAKAQVSNNPSIQSSNRNKEIVLMLYDKGIFNLKDSVAQVAEILGISKNTVYLHIRSSRK
ncbi:MAG: PAS domain-containing protein [Sphaerochaetaceae bacterium]|nr:PAS domain-containing protein [Sphaerochaetaceae bacterium]